MNALQQATDTGTPIKKTLASAYIAFLDILGFKQLVENNPHSYLEEVYLKTLSGNIALALVDGNYVVLNYDGEKHVTPDTTKVLVNSLLISDSIIIWTENDSMEAFIQIVAVVRNLMALSVFRGMPLRGGIALGPLTMQMDKLPSQRHNFQHTLFGKALIDACLLEKDQQWSGCAIFDAAIKQFTNHYQDKSSLPDNLLTLEKMVADKWLCKYEVPRKSGNCDMYVVDWVNHVEFTTGTRDIVSAFPEHNKCLQLHKTEEKNEIETKLANTLKFINHVNPLADADEFAVFWKHCHG